MPVMEAPKYLDFVDRLNQELLKRLERNEKYSLRAFARDLDLDPSNLSKILKRKKAPSIKQIKYIAKNLKIEEEELSFYIEFTAPKGVFYQPYILDDDQQLDHWSYFAILEMLDAEESLSLEDFENKIGIESSELKARLEYLVGAEIIDKKEDFKYFRSKSGSGFSMGRYCSAATKKKLYASYIQKSDEALRKRQNSENVFTTMTMFFDKKDYLEAKDYLRKISLEFDEKFNPKNKKGDSVELYNLSLNFFPLNTNKDKK
jgi:transcriptional regulator with XRE-family HTH domain